MYIYIYISWGNKNIQPVKLGVEAQFLLSASKALRACLVRCPNLLCRIFLPEPPKPAALSTCPMSVTQITSLGWLM